MMFFNHATAVSATQYARVFESNPDGVLVLEDLIRRFGGAVYVKGAHEAERQSCFNAGRRAVLDFIVAQLNRVGESHAHTSR